MKKKIIVTAIIAIVLILIIILGIILINNYNDDKSNNNNQDNSNDTEIEYLFELSKSEIILCKGKPSIAVDYKVTEDVEYTIEVLSSNNNICSIDNFNLIPVNVGTCYIEYKCIFNNDNIFTDYLNITVIEYVETISAEINSLSIDTFDVKVFTDKIPQQNNLSIICVESLVVSDMKYENNIFNFKIKTSHYKEDILIKYKNISNNYNNEITTSLEIIEDVSYIQYDTSV